MENSLDFDLLIERVGVRLRARVLDSPGGQGVRNFELPFDDRDLKIFSLTVLGMGAKVRRIDDPGMREIREFGTKLFDSVFDEDVLSCLDRSIFEAERQQTSLRIRLRIDDDPTSEGVALSGIPWEFLYDRRSGGTFLAASETTTVVRFPTVAKPTQPLLLNPPLRLLALISSPSSLRPLDTDAEWQKLNEALEDLRAQERVVVERIDPPTSEALQRQLRRGDPYHVFHFIGHGAFDERRDEGVVLFETKGGKPDPVSGEELRALLGREPSLRLAVLNACEGARTSKGDPFAGVAQSLVQSGLPAVIAMQMPVTDETAIALSREFYGSLADGYPVDTALAEARVAIRVRVSAVEWGVPVLYMRSRDGRLFATEAGAGDAVGMSERPGPRREGPGESARHGVEVEPREQPEREPPEQPEPHARKQTEPESPEQAGPAPMASHPYRPRIIQTGQWANEVAFSPDGSLIAGGFSQRAAIWSLETGDQVLEFKVGGDVSGVAFSPNGRGLAMGGTTGARLWEVETGAEHLQIPHPKTVTSVSFSPDGRHLATGSTDKIARVWDAETGEEQLQVHHVKWVAGVAFSPDGRLLATASHDKTARVWDVATGSLRVTVHHDKILQSVAFSPDGRLLATAGNDRTARVWDVATGKEKRVLRHDRGYILSVAFSPDGRLLATGGIDYTARVWDLATGAQRMLVRHESSVASVAFSPDGGLLASGSSDKTIRLSAVSGP